MIKLDKLTNQQKILLVIIGAIVLYIYYNQLFTPLNKKIGNLKREISQKEQRLIDARNKAQRLDQLQAELQASQEELLIAEKKLPRAKEVPLLIRSITKSGREYAIDITNLSPRSPISHQYFQEFHYGMSVVTNYHKLARFFGDICQYERILKVKDISMNGRNPTEDDPSTITTSFTLVTYAYLD